MQFRSMYSGSKKGGVGSLLIHNDSFTQPGRSSNFVNGFLVALSVGAVDKLPEPLALCLARGVDSLRRERRTILKPNRYKQSALLLELHW